MRKLLLTVIVALLLCPSAQSGSFKPHRPSWMPRIYYAIGMCETGLKYKWYGSALHGQHYVTAFGMLDTTYQMFRPRGAPLDGRKATPRQQLRAAEKDREVGGGYGGWECYRNGDYQVYM